MRYKIRYGRTFPTKVKYSTMKIELEMEFEHDIPPYIIGDFNREQKRKEFLLGDFIELAQLVESMKQMRNNIFMEQVKEVVSEVQDSSSTREVKE